MGGDFAPHATVAGALQALAELPNAHSLQLVGRPEPIESKLTELLGGELAALASHRERLTIIPASDAIEMSEKPSSALRSKPNSSMAVGLKLQLDGSSDAFVSAGNTGA